MADSMTASGMFWLRPLMADCTYSLRRRKAALGIDCCFSNGGFADFLGTHTPGQKPTSKQLPRSGR